MANEGDYVGSIWELRQIAGLTHSQFLDYQSRGLVPKKPLGGWPFEIAGRLKCVREMTSPKRLSRRLLVVRGRGCPCGDSAHWFHDIEVAKIRDAISDTVAVIRRPVRKMKIVHNVWSLSRDPTTWVPAPTIETWSDLISSCDLRYLSTVFGGILRTIDMVFPTTGIDLAAIPYEEQVSLATLVQLNERRRLIAAR